MSRSRKALWLALFIAAVLGLTAWWGERRAALELDAEQKAIRRSLAALAPGSSEQEVREFLQEQAGLHVAQVMEKASPWDLRSGAYRLSSSSPRIHRGLLGLTGARAVAIAYFDSRRKLIRVEVKTLPSFR